MATDRMRIYKNPFDWASVVIYMIPALVKNYAQFGEFTVWWELKTYINVLSYD